MELAQVAQWGPIVLAVLLIAVHLPVRHRRTIVVRGVVPFPPEVVWTRMNEINARVRSRTIDPDDPTIETKTIDASGGHGTHFITSKARVLMRDAPRKAVYEYLELAGKSFPFGPSATSTEELRALGSDKTAVTLTFDGLVWNAMQWWSIHRALKRALTLAFAKAPTAPTSGQMTWRTAAITSVLAIVSFVAWLGWQMAGLIMLVIVIHELGHYIALRWTGHPAPKLMLVPFLGGIAVGNHPAKTAFDDAIVYLAGAAFSAFFVLCLTGLAALLSPAWHGPTFDAYSMFHQSVGLTALTTAGAIGLGNITQLVPILPFDGGRIWGRLLQSRKSNFTALSLIAITAAACLWLALRIDSTMAAFVGFGALAGWLNLKTGSQSLPPMTMSARVSISAAMVVTIAVHIVPIVWMQQLLIEGRTSAAAARSNATMDDDAEISQWQLEHPALVLRTQLSLQRRLRLAAQP